MSTTEQWRLVPSEPRLMVSDMGRVQIVPSVGGMPHGGRQADRVGAEEG